MITNKKVAQNSPIRWGEEMMQQIDITFKKKKKRGATTHQDLRRVGN